MNGNARLYRSTSDAMLGGVCAGLGNYLHVDATIVRLVFLLLALFTGGAFALAYVIMWVLIPAPGSTAGGPNQVVQENLNEIGAKVRGFTGGASKPSNGGAAPNGGTASNGGAATNGGATPSADPNQAQMTLHSGAASASQTRQGSVPMWLIIIGGVFLLANLGLFHGMHWGMWWPVLLVGLGVMLFMRRNHI